VDDRESDHGMLKATPQLLISTGAFFRHPLREAFRIISSAGYEAVEIMVTSDPYTQEAHLLVPLAEEFGLRIQAVHAPFLLVTRRVWGSDPTGKIYRAVHLAEAVGASKVIVHPPYRWQVRYRRWLETSLEAFSERTGVTVAVENMFPIRLYGERAVSFHSTQGFEDLEQFPFLVLDTSHAAVSGLDIRKTYGKYRSQIRHIHLSNNAGKGWDSHLPVYEDGVLPLEDFVSDVVGDGFDGSISLELDLRPWYRDEGALVDVLVHNRDFVQDRLPSAGKARFRPDAAHRPSTSG
jgi:sugar phosphate isomerase/epimerase